MGESTVVVITADGIELQVYRWAPEGEPRAVVQIQHGLGEHAGRYRRFADSLTDAGYLVYAPDGRGSGRTAQGAYGQWGRDSWPGWVDDVARLTMRIGDDHTGLPLALFGHSMGSFATQQFLVEHAAADDPAQVDAVVLSGTTEVSGLIPLLDTPEPADLSAFNAGFEHRTGFEWLSRDPAEVDAYVADEGCGFASEPFRGIPTLLPAADPARLAAIRADLPILLVSGDADPLAGGGAAVEVVGQRYRDAGLRDVTVRLYAGARHELLNETNRDEVTADILAFLDRAVGS